MGFLFFFLLLCMPYSIFSDFIQPHVTTQEKKSNSRSLIDVKGGPDSVVWIVQLSDLHFSVFHPERALDFRRVIAPALALINPSLVLITGDLTDGKSKDLLTMKQEEREWIEYKQVMDDVIERSHLDRKIFYDLRGNHDNFGVSVVGGKYDFFQKYSINARLGRHGNVNSVTLRGGVWKHLFVGFDSAMVTGVRGPTNLMGHPTDQLLDDIHEELSQWDSNLSEPLTKITFGHFPLSFLALTNSGKSLKDIFLEHSLSAYLCGHLHTKFGKNLKRHHQSNHHSLSSNKYFQLNIHQNQLKTTMNNAKCSNVSSQVKEFWEWEMGDWRKSRVMRILAIDKGHVSFSDIDLTLESAKIIVVPTFPLDSRFMHRTTSPYKYNYCSSSDSSYFSARALVFSELKIVKVVLKVYDSSSGTLNVVMEEVMKKNEENGTRGGLYSVPWNWRAFEDQSAERFWFQIEAVDISGQSGFSQLKPFSVNGLTAKTDWTWIEFKVMGCQWASLYQPILWSVLFLLFFILLVPKAFLLCSGKHYSYKNFTIYSNTRNMGKYLIYRIFWILIEFCQVTHIWLPMLLYLLYLLYFPWFIGQVFTEGGITGYMFYKGWTIDTSGSVNRQSYIGAPDIMVVVLPHLCFVVLPAILVIASLVAEKKSYHTHYVLNLRKKKDDQENESNWQLKDDSQRDKKAKILLLFQQERWMQKLLIIIGLAILWKHFKHCKAMLKAYEMNPLLHSPLYCFLVPLLMVYAFLRTMGN